MEFQYLPVIVLFFEVVLLATLEKNLWKTLFTPTNCIMLPYAVVLAVCVLVDGKMGFYPFYYPSVWVWVVGLLVFYIPSFFLSMLYNASSRKMPVPVHDPFKHWAIPYLERVTEAISVLFLLWTAFLVMTNPQGPGTDEFGIALAGRGFFGHLFTLYMYLAILWIYLVDWKHKKYFFYLGVFFMVATLYMVKGWLLIPLIGGLLIRLLTRRLRLKLKLVIGVPLFGFLFFFLSYWIAMFVVNADARAAYYGMTRSEYAASTATYIQKHFLTYLTAGVYSLSETMARGELEEEDPTKVYTSFYNIRNLFTGEEMVSPVNENYIQTTTLDNGVNVRTFMGTLYLFLDTWHGILFVLVFSLLIHVVFYVSRQFQNLFGLVLVAWYMATLFMGWFDSYVQTLNYVTIPLFALCLYAVVYYLRLSKEGRAFLEVGDIVRITFDKNGKD